MRQPHQRSQQPLLCLILILSTACVLSASAKDPELPIAVAPFEVLLDGLKSPSYLTIDPHDQILLSERDPGQILQVASDRTVTVLIDNLEDPEGLAVDPAGALFVATERERGKKGKGQKGVILRRDPRTQGLSVLTNNFQQPKGLALDQTGNLVLSAEGRAGDNNANGGLFSIDLTGGITRLADGFKQAQGVIVTPDGSLLVAAERFKRGNATVEGNLFRLDPTGAGERPDPTLPQGPFWGRERPAAGSVPRRNGVFRPGA